MDFIEPAPLSGPSAPPLDPDSALVAAAFDLLRRHTADPEEGICQGCGDTYPCLPCTHASLVCRAAGLDPQSSGERADTFAG